MQLVTCIFWLNTKSVEISVVYLNADTREISSPYCQYYKSDTASERQRLRFVLLSGCPAVISFSNPFANDGGGAEVDFQTAA